MQHSCQSSSNSSIGFLYLSPMYKISSLIDIDIDKITSINVPLCCELLSVMSTGSGERNRNDQIAST